MPRRQQDGVPVTAQCWLHPAGQEHGSVMLVGVRVDQQIIPADVRCARQVPEEFHTDAKQITVGTRL